MTFLTSAITAVTHNHWSESVSIENTSDETPELQDHLKCLAGTLHDNLVAALALERLFGEQNDKTMYIAPFIRSVIHTAVTGVEIQHVSSYPVAIDPCFVGDPLLRFLSHYGHATDIICANIPAPVTYEEDGDGITSEGSSSDDDALDEANDYDMESVHEEEAKSESDRTTRRWLAGHYMTKKAEDQAASTDFYHNQHSSTSSDHPPAAPDYSLLARLTTDSSSDSTPLALICVSQAKEIYAAMTSCLYQRLAWGIHEPMAGIALDDKTCNVRILFGRFQPSQDSDRSTVHISDSEKGCYDLSDDSSALEFASFLSRLCRHFPTICETAIAFTPQLEDDIAGCRLKLWRLDQAVLVVPEEGPSWAEQITRWLDRIDASSYVDDQPPCVAASSSNIAGSDVMSAKETRPPSSIGASLDSESMHCRTISATELASGGRHEDKTLLMSFWMLARMVITRTLMFPSMLLDEKYKLDNSFRTIQKEYHDLLSFSWIDNLTVLDRTLQTLPLVEIAQAAADKLKQDALRTVGRWLPYRTLSASCEKILCDNLCEIASVLEDVQRINANGKTHTSELECRLILDRLMMRFFHGHSNGRTEKISLKEYSNTALVMISFECSLMLPNGSLVDALTKCDDITDQVDLMVSVNARTDAITIADCRNISKFSKALSPETSNVVPHARNAPDPTSMSGHHSDRTPRTFAEDVEAVQKFAQAALERNNIGRLGVIHVAKGKENPMLQPYKEEPLNAVCDSVGYIRIPEVFTSIPASSSFNIIQPRHASPSPSKSIPKQSMPSDSDSGTGNGTSLARRQQMGRDFEMDNPDDLFAISQSFSVSMDPSRIEPPVPLPVEQASKHSLNMSVLRGGELEDNDETEKMAELDVRRDLFLPIISSEHKKVLGVFFATNVYQGRMYATASVKFYVALGIYNIGVYTIISEGSVLVVTVSYAEKPDDEDGVPIVHILERNAISFDISEPLGILNFATFLIKLRVEYVPKVLKRVYSVIGDSPVEIRKYLKTLNIPTGGDKNQAAWRKHKP